MKLLRDTWFLFSIVALMLCGLTIIIPQIRLMAASLLEEGGQFTLLHNRDGLQVVPEMTGGYAVTPQANGLVIAMGSGAALTVAVEGGQSLLITSSQPLAPGEDAEGRPALDYDGTSLSLSQQAPRGLFATAAPAPLVLEPQSATSIRLSHAANAYITFENKALSLSARHYFDFFTQSPTVTATVNSLLIALISTALAAVAGISLAYILARYEIAGSTAIVFLVTMASVSPPFLGAYAWRLLLGRNGVITSYLGYDMSIVGMHGVIWVITWLVFPIIFLLSYGSFRSLDAGHIEAAESLGAAPSRVRFSVEIPLALPGIITGLYLATMAALSDFGTPRIIGLDVNVLPVLIYTSFLSEAGRNPALAATGSVVLIVISSLFLMAQQIYLARRGFAVVASRPLQRKHLSPFAHALALCCAALALLMAFTPHLTVLVSSFMEWRVGLPRASFTLVNYETMMRTGLGPAWVTLSLGIAGTLAATGLGLGIAFVLIRKRYALVAPVLGLTVMMPYVIPGTVLGIGLIMMFNQAPLQLTGTWFILALAYLIRNLPFTVKASEAALRRVHPALEEAALSLGARPFRVFATITAPLVLAGAITGATLTFLHIVTELSSTIVLYRPPWKPMTAVIFENTLVDADFGVSAAQTILLMLIIYVPLYFIVRYGQTEGKSGV
ncbi:Putrescine transport system permease protein PotH [Pannonibacter phragmitetus]|uniref:Putrescine transport system permease protein PotH n=1 Tax=Pannonibacter phragmitetus TaxID=121719 RepID=A0A378ZY21_9HYPH|nr:iron ABC transporter permease [Pannonibacter phragmitetus]SUB01883.1 Putrescine transport system permease protein PotH [Pannonibacter phragmitetus]